MTTRNRGRGLISMRHAVRIDTKTVPVMVWSPRSELGYRWRWSFLVAKSVTGRTRSRAHCPAGQFT